MSKKSRTEYSILNIITGLAGYCVNTVLGLVCRMVFTRTLVADYLGISGLFTNILSMLSLAELGIGTAIVYALYKPLATDDHEKITSLVCFYGKCYRTIGLVVGSIGLLIMPFLGLIIKQQPNIQESLKFIYCIYLFNTAGTYFFSYRGALISAAQQNYVVTGINYAVTITQSVLQMIWLVLTHNYLGYLVIQTIGIFVYNVTISAVAKRIFPYINDNKVRPLDKTEKQSLIKNVRALLITKLSGLLVNSTDNIIITYFSGLISVGLASNYTLLSSTLNSLLNQLFSGISASVGNLNAIESKEKKMAMFYNINFVNFWMYAWAAIGICAVSSDIVMLLFGEKYVLPNSIPFVIALNFYMVGIQNAVWTYESTMGLFRQYRYALLFTAAINLVCSIILGKKYGLFGILFATSISRFLTNTWIDPLKLFKFGFNESVVPYFLKRAKYVCIVLITGEICYIVCSFVCFSAIINILIKFSICCIIPNFLFYIVFRNSTEFAYFKSMFSRVFSKIAGKYIRGINN